WLQASLPTPTRSLASSLLPRLAQRRHPIPHHLSGPHARVFSQGRVYSLFPSCLFYLACASPDPLPFRPASTLADPHPGDEDERLLCAPLGVQALRLPISSEEPSHVPHPFARPPETDVSVRTPALRPAGTGKTGGPLHTHRDGDDHVPPGAV